MPHTFPLLAFCVFACECVPLAGTMEQQYTFVNQQIDVDTGGATVLVIVVVVVELMLCL